MPDTDVIHVNKEQVNQCSSCSTRRVCPAANIANDISTFKYGKPLHSHNLKTGCHIFHAGAKLEALYIVKSGMFKTYLITKTGDERVISFYLPGEVIGVDAFANGKHRNSAMAIETSTLCTVLISDLCNNMLPSNWLVKQASQEILRERQSFLIASRKHCANAKIALFLLDLSERHRLLGYSFNTFKLNMPRRDLANHLDLALETVSRVLTRLQGAGILELNRRQVTINDIDYLSRIAGTETEHHKLDYY
jgi:CRP/FNR family transcriptional regulator